MKGLQFDPTAGRLTIVNGSRTVATSDGTLVNLLTTEHDFGDTSIVFPDFTKDYLYYWTFTETWDGHTNFITNAGAAYTSIPPQEQSSKTTLMAAPAGADIFVGQVKLQRTVAPANTWVGNTLTALSCVSNGWLLWDGSAKVEQGVGMSRAIHVYIDGSNNLVIEQQQSVGQVVNDDNWGNFGDSAPTFIGNKSGYSENFGTLKGLPVFLNDSTTGSQSYAGGYSGGTGWNNCRLGGTKQASLTDTTNYSSTYLVSVKGYFGRRS